MNSNQIITLFRQIIKTFIIFQDAYVPPTQKFLTIFYLNQKQSFRSVRSKSCPKNIQEIYRRTPMPKYDFNKLYWWHFCMGVLLTAWKVSKYGVFSGPYFSVFGQNTEIYGVNLPIQSEYRKIRTRKNSVFRHFSCSACNFTTYLQNTFAWEDLWKAASVKCLISLAKIINTGKCTHSLKYKLWEF